MKIKIIHYAVLILIFIFLFDVTGCKKDENNEPPDNPADTLPPASTDPQQYGEPFSGIPVTSDIIMYEINERAFSTSGDFAGILPRLDSISALGVNVIWLMPVNPIGEINSVNSPYCVKDFMGVNPEYGDLEDLRDLVEEAHNRGMAVILDWAANHTSWDNDWIENADWYTQDNEGNIIHPAGTNWEDVADLNYDNSQMRLEMIRALKYWVLTANVDGYRCDAADYVPYDFWKQAIDSLNNIPNRELILLAEGARSNHFDAGFQMNFSWDFFNKNKDVFSNSQSATGYYQVHQNEYNNIPDGKHKLRFTSNHDECAWDDTPIGLFGGKEASLSAFVITAYMGGVPLVYNGQEVGCPVKLPFFSNYPIDWTINPDMFQEYKSILNIRNSNIALRQGELDDFSDDDIAAFTRTYEDNEVFILVNARNEPKAFSLPASIQGTGWQDVQGVPVTLESTVDLEAYEYIVYIKSE